MKQYKALKAVGRFSKDDFVGGFSEAEIKKLVADGVIAEVTTKATKAQDAKAEAK